MTIIVGPEGSTEAKIAIVGEAAGATEEATGRPFVGKAGQLLNECLGNAGIIRSQCYITNVIKERPPNNNIAVFIDLSKKQPMKSPAYNQYVSMLKMELENCDANVIVAVGNVPLYALCGKQQITKRRGSILESTLLPGRKVIPIIHPSAALRMYLYRYHIVHDLKRVLAESSSPDMNLPKREIILRPSYEEALGYISICLFEKMVAFDIEVSNEQISCISLSYSSNSGISIPFTNGPRDYWSPDEEYSIWKNIAQLLERPEVGHLGQNAVFDSTFLYDRYGIRVHEPHDTMIAQAILTPDFPKGLDFITSIYTREPYYKDEGKYRIKAGLQSDEGFWKYNALDSIVLMDAFPELISDIEKIGNLETYERQRKLIEPLVFMYAKGIKVDTVGVKASSERVGREIIELTGELHRLCGFPLNPRSPKQVKDYFYITKGLPPYKKRGGGITTDDTAMKRIARKGYKEARIILDIRQKGVLKSTFLDANLDSDNRLRSAFNPVGATTGRISSSKTIFGTGMNMMNQPHYMYQYYLADEGYVLYPIDLEQAENRLVAKIGPEPTMDAAFESGKDVHKLTASLIFNKPVEEISDEDGSSTLGNGDMSERFWGKKCNHAFNYALGYKKFALLYELPENQAKLIRDNYYRVYPGVSQYQAFVREQLQIKNRIVTNLFGRKRIFMDRWSDDLFKDAYAFIPQSTVADIINERGLEFVYYNDEEFEHLELLNQVHDSIWFQLPINIGWSEHARMIGSIIKSLETPLQWMGKEFSIPAAVKMGTTLGNTQKIDVKAGNVAQQLESVYGNLI